MTKLQNYFVLQMISTNLFDTMTSMVWFPVMDPVPMADAMQPVERDGMILIDGGVVNTILLFRTIDNLCERRF